MTKFATVLVLAVFCVAISAALLAIAEPVEHHGLIVEEAGTAEECISCHDGSVAGHVSYCTVKCDFRTPHVIMKHYPPLRNATSFVPREVVEAKGVRFVQGKVTCISCHNLKNQYAPHLFLDSEGQLCLICHIK